MCILTRYVLLEFLKVFTVTMTATTVLILVVGVAVEAKQEGIGLAEMLQLLPYLLPEALRFSTPAMTLLAACNVFGRLSADNEIIAVKAAGIPPWRLLRALFLLGIGLSLIAVWVNEMAVTWGRRGIERVVVQSAEQIAYGMLRTKRSYSTDRLSMHVAGVQDRKLLKPTLLVTGQGSNPTVTIAAASAELNTDTETGELVIRFQDAQIDVGRGGGGVTWPGVYEHRIQLSEISRKGGASLSPSNCPLLQIGSRVDQLTQEIQRREQAAAVEAGFAMLAGEIESLADPNWQRRSRQIDDTRRRLHRLRTEPYRRWANGFSCLAFVVVGAPLAILNRKGDFLTSFFITFMPILVLYYPLLAMAVDRAKSGTWPPQSVWLGNLVMFAAGLVMVRRVQSY